MGAVEHLKTLCCLGLPPERAMIAVRALATRELSGANAARVILREVFGVS